MRSTWPEECVSLNRSATHIFQVQRSASAARHTTYHVPLQDPASICSIRGVASVSDRICSRETGYIAILQCEVINIIAAEIQSAIV